MNQLSLARVRHYRATATMVAVFVALGSAPDAALAGGCSYRNGVGARIRGVAGAGVAWAADANEAMAENPAALAFLQNRQVGLNITSASVVGDFSSAAGSGGSISNSPFFVPDGSYAQPIGDTGFVVGAGLMPQMMLQGNWEYVDPPGAAGGASYGMQNNDSEFLLLRTAAGLAKRLGERVAVGGSYGLVYNRNRLRTPYIFQNEPTLTGLKTLLDLGTTGYDSDACLGAMVDLAPSLRLGVTYKSGLSFTSTGTATGDARAQFDALGLGVPADFSYDAEVNTHAPQMTAVGLAWQASPKLDLLLQWEWLDWSGAMPHLPIALTGGTNAAINGLLNSTGLNDRVPFEWKDRHIFRVGGEFELNERWALRSGFARGDSAVPDATLTPLTADITENTLAFGVGYRRGGKQVNVAYQWDMRERRDVGRSMLAGGEYNGSRVAVGLHWITISTSLDF